LSTSTSVYWYWVFEKPRADRYVLRGLHIQRDAPNRLQRVVQAPNHLVSGGRSLAERRQRDEHTAVILGDGRPAGPDTGFRRGDRGAFVGVSEYRDAL
jgi:hypothetical protein